MAVTQLLKVSLTVSDLDKSIAFFCEGLGLEAGPQRQLEGEGWCSLLGLEPGTRIRTADIAFEGERLELAAFDPPGQPYPVPRASNDPWFEHVALVAGDIEAVAQELSQAGSKTVTVDGPVLLPPNTGSVTAFKFRDQEGHPLELLSFPDGVGDPRWQQGGPGIRGFDHTAIVVTDLSASVSFYTDILGMGIGGRSLNRGAEQDRLDGLSHCLVDVVALQPSGQKTPHVELLRYRNPHWVPAQRMPDGQKLPAPPHANDVAAVRQVHKVDDLDDLLARLKDHGAAFVSDGIIDLEGEGRAAAIRDPDGHMIVLLD